MLYQHRVMVRAVLVGRVRERRAARDAGVSVGRARRTVLRHTAPRGVELRFQLVSLMGSVLQLQLKHIVFPLHLLQFCVNGFQLGARSGKMVFKQLFLGLEGRQFLLPKLQNLRCRTHVFITLIGTPIMISFLATQSFDLSIFLFDIGCQSGLLVVLLSGRLGARFGAVRAGVVTRRRHCKPA